MNLIEFSRARSLKIEHVHELGLKEYEKDGQTWVEIPYFKSGQKVNAKHRCLDEKKFFQDKDGEKIFYNIDCLYNDKMADDTLFITEGEIDAITLIQEGYVKTISVPEGAPNEETGGEGNKYQYLGGMIETLRQQPEIILAVDEDTNGTNLLNDLAKRIGKGKCKWIKYPKECKDINETYVKYGLKGIQKSLATAQSMRMDGVHKLSDFPPPKPATVFQTGHPIADLFKYRKGDFSVWTGMPAAGKTTLVNDILCSTVAKNDIKVCFISLEQHPKIDHERALTTWYMSRFPNFSYDDALKWIDEHFIFIHPSEEQQLNDSLDINWLLEHTQYAVDIMNIDVVVLDPWNELEHLPEVGESLTEYVGYAIRKMKRFAKVNNVHFQVVAHPKKMVVSESGKCRTPTLYDIADSAHWANKADIGVVLHREKDESGAQFTAFNVVKVRYEELIGNMGSKRLVLNRNTMSFTEYQDG